jgi:hypothetical protein
MASLYRQFVPNFSKLVETLNDLLKKGIHLHWGQERDQAFRRLMTAIAHPTVLRMAKFTQGFILQTDAYDVDWAVILSQEHDRVRLPIT